MGVNDFANDDMMITLLDGGCYTAFDRARRIDQKGRSGRAFAERLPTDLAVIDVRRPVKGKSQTFVVLSEHVERERLCRFHGLIAD